MSERKITFWLNSGANIHSCRKVQRTFYEIGIEEDVWDNMTEDEKEEVAKEICFERADWGWSEE
jgi:hypothetical protein